MSEQTKAELQERLDAAIKLNARYERQLSEIDDEARAIDGCIRAVSGLKSSDYTGYNRDRTDRVAIRRVLNAVAARFGISPDFEAIARLVEERDRVVALTSQEREELDRLRRMSAVLDDARYGNTL